MNREVFESLLWNISEKSEWPSPGPADAIDIVMAEFDRLRWHYIEDNEYPPNDGDMDFIAECIFEIYFPKDLDYCRIMSYKDYYWVAYDTIIYLDEIQRWRYTE